MSQVDALDNEGITQDHLNSSAREARRQRNEQKRVKKDSGILITTSRRSTPVLLYPWRARNFPDEYHERLPEWRVRAGHSALQDHWHNWREFQLAILATELGFSNVLYFPVHAIAYGRGTYVLAFILTEFLIGFPLVFFELVIGQFTSQDVVRVFSLFPLAEGVGISLMLKSIIRVITFNYYLAWLAYYIYRSLANVQFTPTFVWQAPWADCVLNEAARTHLVKCGVINVKLHNNTEFLCAAVFFNDVALNPTPNCTSLYRATTENDATVLNWPLVCCLIVLSILGFIIIFRGIKSIGYFVTWMVPTMYITLLLLLIAIVCYKGALEGILYLFTPEYTHFNVIEMLVTVVIQVMQSLSLDTGGMIVVGSYAHFQSLAHYHALGACIADVVVTLLTACIFFGLMGITATHYDVEIYDLIDQTVLDLDLSIFTIMSSAVGRMWCPLLWAFLFFFVFAGMVESATICETLVFLKPVYHTVNLTEPRRHVINVCAVIGIFLLTLPLTTREGVVFYQLSFVQRDQLRYSAILVVMCAVTFIIYGYGLKRFRQSIDFMTEYLPNTFFSVMWLGVPFLLLALLISVLIGNLTTHVDAQEEWVGWTVCVAVLLPIPVIAIWNLFSFKKKDKLVRVLRPRDEAKWSRLSIMSHDDGNSANETMTRAEALMEFLRATDKRRSSVDTKKSAKAAGQSTSTEAPDDANHHVSFFKGPADMFSASGLSSSSGPSYVTDSEASKDTGHDEGPKM